MPRTIAERAPLPTERIYTTLEKAVYPGAKVVLLTIEDYHSGKVKEMYAKAFDPKDYADLKLVQLSVDQYHRMRDHEILPEGEHIELLDGIMYWVDRRASAKKPLPMELVALNVNQYHRLIDAGVLEDCIPIELFNGLLVWKDRSARGENPMTLGDYHMMVIKKLVILYTDIAAAGADLSVQAACIMPDRSEPEPDGYIVRAGTKIRPLASELLCAIEASDSSLGNDRKHKLTNYANAGIPQYVIINIPDMQVEVYERPIKGDGRYKEKTVLKRGQKIKFVVGKQRRLEIAVERVLP